MCPNIYVANVLFYAILFGIWGLPSRSFNDFLSIRSRIRDWLPARNNGRARMARKKGNNTKNKTSPSVSIHTDRVWSDTLQRHGWRDDDFVPGTREREKNRGRDPIVTSSRHIRPIPIGIWVEKERVGTREVTSIVTRDLRNYAEA